MNSGGVVQLAHLFLVPETRTTIILDREAKRLRKESGGVRNIWGPSEIRGKHIPFKEVITIWVRPFHMFLTEVCYIAIHGQMVLIHLVAYCPVPFPSQRFQ
jgi:hypothetical protein